MKTINRRIYKRIAVVAIAIVMVFTCATTVFADTVGNAGNARDGAATNTFAQNMDLQTIYLDYDILHTVQTATNVTGEGLSVDGGGVYLSGEKLPATGTTNFTGYSWDYVYPSAATYPDGTKGDVTLHCVLNKIYTASLDAKNKNGNLIPADMDPMPNFEGTVGVWGGADGNHASARVS